MAKLKLQNKFLDKIKFNITPSPKFIPLEKLRQSAQMCVVCAHKCLAFHSKLTAQQLQRRSRSVAIMAIVNNFRMNDSHSYPSTKRRTSVQWSESCLWHEQGRTTFPNSHWSSKSNDALIRNPVADIFWPEGRNIYRLPMTHFCFGRHS
jgi:hypothetical protein